MQINIQFPTFSKEEQELLSLSLKAEKALHLCTSLMLLGKVKMTETISLRVRDIDMGSNLIELPDGTKLPLNYQLREILNAINIDSFPLHYYLLGAEGKPSSHPVSLKILFERHRHFLDQWTFGANYSLATWWHSGLSDLYTLTGDIKLLQKYGRFNRPDTAQRFVMAVKYFARDLFAMNMAS